MEGVVRSLHIFVVTIEDAVKKSQKVNDEVVYEGNIGRLRAI
jgi:hypothetical protein